METKTNSKSEGKFRMKSDGKFKAIDQKMKHKHKQSKSYMSTVCTAKMSTCTQKSSSSIVLDKQLKYMSTMSLLLPEDTPSIPELNPPPSTPEGEFNFGFTFHRLPKTFRDLTQLQMPIVRSVGVKGCIAVLGSYFDCSDYEFNFLHFWFLDVLTDCIWRSQDQYEFPEEQQKIVLSWVLFFLDVIKDPNHVFSQKAFFALFKESILAAAEVLEEGSGKILLPVQLINVKNDSERSSKANISSKARLNINNDSSDVSKISCKTPTEPNDSMDYDSLLEFQIGPDYHQFLLDHEICNCDDYDDSISSSAEPEEERQNIEGSLSNNQSADEFAKLSSLLNVSNEEKEEDEIEPVDDFTNDDWSYKNFYKPDEGTPSRFLSLNSVDEMDNMDKNQINKRVSIRDLGDPSKLTFLKVNCNKSSSLDQINDYIIFRKESASSSHVSVCDEPPVNFSKNIVESEKMKEEKIIQEWKYYKLMEQRAHNLNNSSVGLSDNSSHQISSTKTAISVEIPKDTSAHCFNSTRMEALMKARDLKELSIEELLSYGVIWAIIDFIYEYFGDSFQYSLIRTALTIIPNTYLQTMNKTWRSPKGLKEDLTVYVKDLKQKYAKIQRKLEKAAKDKKDKVPKSPKDKKEKRGEKKSQKSDKKVKVDKRSLKEAKMEEMLLKKKLAEEEAERMRQFMNIKFLSPLQEAIDEHFFSAKFPQWGNVLWKRIGKEKKQKKEEIDKKEKTEKKEKPHDKSKEKKDKAKHKK